MEAVFVSTFAGRDTGSVLVRTQAYNVSPKTGDLAPKVGASATVDGVAVKITGIKKLGPGDAYASYGMGNPNESKGPRWLVTMAVDKSKNPEASLFTAPIGTDGQPIRFADDSGKPKPPPKDPRGFTAGFPNASQSVGGREMGQSLLLGVDPKDVKRFSIGVQRASVAFFRDIPLDPRK